MEGLRSKNTPHTQKGVGSLLIERSSVLHYCELQVCIILHGPCVQREEKRQRWRPIALFWPLISVRQIVRSSALQEITKCSVLSLGKPWLCFHRLSPLTMLQCSAAGGGSSAAPAARWMTASREIIPFHYDLMSPFIHGLVSIEP